MRPLDRGQLAIIVLLVVVVCSRRREAKIIGRELSPQQGRLNFEDPTDGHVGLSVSPQACSKLVGHPISLGKGEFQVERASL